VPWPFRPGPAPEAGPRREGVEPSAPQPPLYRSPVLQTLLASLRDDGSYRILDLGAAVGPNVGFFSRYSCHLDIVDLLGTIAAKGLSAALEADPAAALRQVLPEPHADVDVVLAWDVLNYLGRPQLRALAERLGALCRPGGHVFALISTAKQMPELPTAYRIVDEQTLDYRPRSAALRPSPRIPPAEVEKLAPGFAVERSVLMRHGVQEYLLARRRED